MKKVMEIIIFVFCTPIFLLITIGFAIYTPIDYVKYKNTQYYKNTKEKYSWLASISYCVRLYEIIKFHHLPINFHKIPNMNLGYFIYKDVLILNEYDPYYNESECCWMVEIEDEYVNIETAVEKDIKECNDFLKREVCNRAALLLTNDDILEEDLPRYDKFEFLLVSQSDTATVLSDFIKKYD